MHNFVYRPINRTLNIAIQAVVSVVAFIGVIAIENVSCLNNNTYTVMTDMVCFNMRKFSRGLRPERFTYENKMELRNIFVQLQDLEAYLNELNDHYYWKFFHAADTDNILRVFGNIFTTVGEPYCHRAETIKPG